MNNKIFKNKYFDVCLVQLHVQRKRDLNDIYAHTSA